MTWTPCASAVVTWVVCFNMVTPMLTCPHATTAEGVLRRFAVLTWPSHADTPAERRVSMAEAC